MDNARKFRSLTVQTMAVICGAGLLALLVGMGGYIMGMSAVERFYFSDTAIQKRLSVEITSFRDYVEENQVASTDVTRVEAWNREHPHTQLTIKGLETMIRSNSYGAELMGTESGILVQYGQVADTGMEFPVNFTDGVFGVTVYESSQTVLYELVKVSAIVVGALVFLLMVMIYDRKVTQAIQTLSRQVRQVSQGELDRKILCARKDEIGQLAVDVDTMRLSIIEKLQREEAAWQANSNLITAISHDVRTPLTALMGYLELLDDEEIPWQQRQAYLEICKNHAHRLKGLTDELFGFFLVFGKPEPDVHLQEFEVNMLLEQILLEKELELSQMGFTVDMEHGNITGKLRVDLGHLRRIFDNLFSNVRKYGDLTLPVTISQSMKEGKLCIRIANAVLQEENRVERNGIGLQTCRKLITSMGGSFCKEHSEGVFSVEFMLPVYE